MRSASTNINAVVIALGTNLGPREYLLRRAQHELGDVVRIVRRSRIIVSAPIDAPRASPDFLNMVIAGYTALPAEELLEAMHAIEARLGRVRRAVNGPRTIDLDLILYGAHVARTTALVLPHPRYRHREFVTGPLRELQLGWHDPVTGAAI